MDFFFGLRLCNLSFMPASEPVTNHTADAFKPRPIIHPMLAHTVRLLYRANQKHDLRIIKMHNALLKTSIGKREITVREVFPTFDVGTLDFDARVATRALEDGYIAAVEALRGVEC